MKNNPQINHRRSLRLRDYDYSQAGGYFVTVCTQGGGYLLGEIIKGEMRKNEIGEMIENWWLKLKDKFINIQLDEYVIMPNHFHGIMVIVGVDPCVNPENQTWVRPYTFGSLRAQRTKQSVEINGLLSPNGLAMTNKKEEIFDSRKTELTKAMSIRGG